MTMLLEQHSSSEASGGNRTSRRLLIWDRGEGSPACRVGAWLALGVTVAIAVLLLVGA